MSQAPDTTEYLPPPVAGQLKPMDLSGLLREIERAYIDAALAQTAGNRRRAATLLGLRRTTLVEKLRRRQKREHEEPTFESAAAVET
jgi:DNA-binding NtrC family response regulator